jgi:hypothetical protein
MDVWYLVVVYVHVVTVAVWLGAMLFEDPASNRFMTRMVVRIRGIGWLALLILIVTGAYLLGARGVGLADVLSGRFFAERYGQVFAVKLAFVALLVGLQVTKGHRPSRALYGYLASILIVIALSIWLVRPIV